MNAIFTVQHNEQFYLPKWIKYYSSQFALEDMYIYAHNCSGDTLDILETAKKQGINVIPVTTDEIFNHDWLTNLVHDKQKELLKDYDYVVYTDCDEFIVPTTKTLRRFLETATKPAYRCEGFNALGKKVYPDPRFFNKTLITRIPLTYEYGYHSSKPEFPVNKDLVLFHIHRLDYDEAFNRNLRLANEEWDKKAVDGGMSIQNQLVHKAKFDEWYYEGLGKEFDSTLFNKLLEQICE